MPFAATVLNVVIASPGDTRQSRDAIEAALHSWNSDRAESANIIVLPRRWETDAVPSFQGIDAQDIINSQLIDNADIVFGVFYSRLGKATARGVSGTAEEIERAADAGKPVHVYFSTAHLPSDVDTEQLTALRAFSQDLRERGLLGEFASDDDLKAKVRTAIERDISNVSAPARNPSTGVILRAAYNFEREPTTDNKGRVRYKNRRERLTVTNSGSETAHGVRLELEPIGEGEAPSLWNESGVDPDILAGSDFSFPTMMHMGIASAWNVTMSWTSDDGEGHSVTQIVSH